MKEPDTGFMEENLIRQEDVTSDPEPSLEKNVPASKFISDQRVSTSRAQGLLKQLKRPKYITLTVAFISIIVILVAFVAVSVRPKTQVLPEPNTEIATPVPEKTPKPTNIQIQSELDKYNQKVEGLKSKSRDFSPPLLDLDIKF